MTKIAAVLPNDEVAEAVTDRLAHLQIEDLTWELIQEKDDIERLFPAFIWPAGATGQGGSAVGAPLGLVAHTKYPEDRALKDEGADDDVADYYAQNLTHGAKIIVVDALRKDRDQVHHALENAGATDISWD